MFNIDLFGAGVTPEKKGGKLSEAWDYPPFSVLNARDGWWQERKRQWLALGIKSEIGRGAAACDPAQSAPARTNRAAAFQRLVPGGGGCWLGGPPTASSERFSGANKMSSTIAALKPSAIVEEGGTGTSIFDPVLCELAYRWFCPPGGTVLDPFAGGSVRGIVASYLGWQYHGIELRAEQCASNEAQIDHARTPRPLWHNGDSRDAATCSGISPDFIFSCPPYADLERYSDDPRDLSTMDYPAFIAAYREIIATCCGLLKPDRFACFVVGDVRDGAGLYRNFVGDTVEAFRAAGLGFYNEAILVTAVGSLPIRVNRQFAAGRKLGKTHQNVLVFVKGDGKRAARACST